MRLIDADALVEAMTKFSDAMGEDMTHGIFYTHIAPTINAVPVRHGKWLDDGQYDNFFPHHEWRCSECGEHVLEIGTPWFKYCPTCGARMDAERKEE